MICYASRTLNEAQLNYTTTEKEFLAVVFVLEKFRQYLLGSRITIFTDHSALRYLMQKKDAKLGMGVCLKIIYASFYTTLPWFMIIKIEFLLLFSLIFQVHSLMEKKAQILGFLKELKE